MYPLTNTPGPVAAQVRHDLRNPLSDILGFCDVLREEALERELTHLLPEFKLIHEAASHIFGEVNHTLSSENLRLNHANFTGLEATIRLHAEKILLTTESLSQQCDLLDPNSFGDDLLRISSSARKLRDASPALFACLRENRAEPFLPGSLTVSPQPARPPSDAQDAVAATLLVVDDNESNRALLARRLRRQGYTVVLAENGRQALDKLRNRRFDLVLLDVLMPEMDGYRVLTAMKADEALRHVPVLMISALDDLEVLSRCIESGADDYLSKPFDPVLLRARISSSLEKKRLHDQEQRTYRALVESQGRLAAELAEAADYVRSLLPAPLSGDPTADWRFVPSSQLGGDAFGYQWIDSDHFVVYLLDVCSHGVGAALLSISVMNVLGAPAMGAADLRRPGEVLGWLNRLFSMDRQNNLYFTIWYGVFHRPTRRLTYATGGHPPAVLIAGESRPEAHLVALKAPGPPVGTFPEHTYATSEVVLPPFNRLFLFSDGAYEIVRPDGSMLTLEEFNRHLEVRTRAGNDSPGATLAFVEETRGARAGEDDLALVECGFGTDPCEALGGSLVDALPAQ